MPVSYEDSNGVCCSYQNMERPKTTYNHLKKFNNHLQQPQKHQQPLANNLTPSETRHKCLKQHVTYMKYENRTKHLLERAAVPSPRGKTGGRERLRKAGTGTNRVMDVKVIYVSYVNKLYFLGKSVCTHVLTQTNLFICRFLFGLSTFFSLHGHFMLFYRGKLEPSDRACYGKFLRGHRSA